MVGQRRAARRQRQRKRMEEQMVEDFQRQQQLRQAFQPSPLAAAVRRVNQEIRKAR